jgi:hypothetical protein
MTLPPVTVLFVGDSERTEFASTFQWLRDHSQMTSVPDFASALEQLAAQACDPELIVLAQAWPGQFSPKQIERLRRLAPLARISELLGSWCEGETRTGRPPGGTLRNYWHQWVPRMAPEFRRAARGERPVWSLPTTASDDERLLAVSDAFAAGRLCVPATAANLPPPATMAAMPAAPGETPMTAGARGGLIAILLRNAAMARTLCDACPARGFAGVWLPEGRGPYLAGARAAVWDAPPDSENWAEQLANVGRDLKGTPIVALASFPRIDDVDRLRAAGVAAVVSKPFWWDDLFWQLERL